MRKAHYLTKSDSREYPRHCLWVDTETKQRMINDKDVKHILWFGWACYRRRSRGNKWSRPYWFRFKTVKEFWAKVDELVDKRESLTMFAHNMGFDSTVLDTFNYLPKQGWQLRSAVIDSPPLILKWRKDSRTIRMLCTLNIWPVPLDKLGKTVGIEKLPFPTSKRLNKEWDTYCKRDVEVIMQACIYWFTFLQDNDLGGFAPTLAAQALKSYRHSFMDHPILIDDDKLSLSIARDAFHGGRTEAFFIGKMKGPLYYLDINSMYPFVMKKYDYPTELIAVYKDVRKKDVREWLRDHCVIVECLVKTKEPAYSIIKEGKLIFPVGTFWTTLTTHEIKYALKNKHIVKFGLAAVYKKAPIFKRFIDKLYNMRLKFRKLGNLVYDMMTKRLMNSLYGKFGQRGRVYNTVDYTDDMTIATWEEFDFHTRDKTKFRQLAGLIQSMKEEGESFNSHPAITAHVTANSRMLLWSLIKEAGLRNVFYTDTDSLVVNELGYKRLYKYIHPDKLGKLKLEKIIKRAEIYGPKDYVFDDVFKIKGVKFNALWLDRNKVEQEQWLKLRGLIQRGDLSAPITKTVVKTLRREYTKGTVTKTGRVSPFRLSLE